MTDDPLLPGSPDANATGAAEAGIGPPAHARRDRDVARLDGTTNAGTTHARAASEPSGPPPPPFPDGGAPFPDGDPAACPVERTLRLVSGRWRLLVLFRLGARGPTRWGALRRSLAPVTPRVLTATLRGLEADGLVWRRTEAVVPPAVTYGLTKRGAALAPVFEAMAAWGTATWGMSAWDRPENEGE